MRGRFPLAVLVAFAGTAFAISAAAAPPAARNWTGFYIGGNLGAALGHSSGTSDFLDPAAAPGFQTNPQGNSFSGTNFLGGVQAGYNWQFNERWVTGVEADWDWTHLNSSFCQQIDSNSPSCTDAGFGFQGFSSTTNWLATIRGRLGVTVADFLLYGTGGVALADIDTTLSQNCLVTNCGNSPYTRLSSSSDTKVRIGWVAGLGAEYAVAANWSLKAEWLYIDLGTIDDSLNVVAKQTGLFVPPAFAPQTTSWSRSVQYNLFRVGFNYRFH